LIGFDFKFDNHEKKKKHFKPIEYKVYQTTINIKNWRMTIEKLILIKRKYDKSHQIYSDDK